LIQRHEAFSASLNRVVTISVYVPRGDGPFPVLYMHDGHNLFDKATSSYNQIWQVEDAFTYDIASVIVVGIDAPQDMRRLDELCPFVNQYSKGLGEQYLQFVLETKAMIDATYPTKPERESTGIMGASMGGFISTVAFAMHSDVFSKYGFVSNSYWIDERIFWLLEQATLAPSKVYMDVGTNEAGLGDSKQYLESNRRMKEIIEAKGQVVNYHEFDEAEHNEREWAVRLPLILRYLFGGQG
jgi:predicted alpha/beta superfamily hydrolase